jgi:eukaryotic translation initiation factor 2-alpha kinase 3
VFRLEELARTRAAELLNAGTPGAAYSRVSSDVQPVAQKMFTQVSRVLSQNGLLPMAFASDDLQSKRRQYLGGLDKIGLQALQHSDMSATESTRLIFPNTELAITKALVPTTDSLPALIANTMDSLNLKPQAFMTMPSPLTNMQLSMATPTATRSRFRSEFQEIRVLGKGGFGQVHHVINFVDNQHYAVKRIPLSSKTSRRWHESGLEESDKVLREIRTLARLEHCNIVRYYNAWIENPSLAPDIAQRSSSAASASRKLLTDWPALSPRPNVNRHKLLRLGEDRSGMTFEEQSTSQGHIWKSEIEIDENTLDSSSTSTIPLRDSEVFTDGRSQVSSSMHHLNEDESAYVLHLQMSIHPITLTTYLSPAAPNTQNPPHPTTKRHCFHLIPTLRLLLGIICGLQYLHNMHIVHRDIKPGNILLSECSILTGVVPTGFCDASCPSCTDRTGYYLNPRIADFGLVSDIRRSSTMSSPTKSKAVGTEFYRPPFSAKGKGLSNENIDKSLDVFALGIVLFEMLWPFSTKMERHLLLTDLSHHGQLPANFVHQLDARNRGIGDTIAACILGMVEKDSRKRWTCDMVKKCAEDVLLKCQQESPPLQGSLNSDALT